MLVNNLASLLGRIARDTVEGITSVVEEVVSIPQAFAEGYNKGLLTTESEQEEEVASEQSKPKPRAKKEVHSIP